jgi:hypothetical protein
MADKDGEKPGANGGADDKSKSAGDNTDDAKSGTKSAADDKSGEGNKGDAKPEQVVFESQAAVDRMIQKRIERATKDAEDNAKLSKEQLLAKERDDALAAVRTSDARDAFISQSKIPDYSKASKLFRMYASDLEFDDKGKVTNMADVIKSAKADWPEVFGKVAPGSGDLHGGKREGDKPAGSDMNSVLRRATGRGGS